MKNNLIRRHVCTALLNMAFLCLLSSCGSSSKNIIIPTEPPANEQKQPPSSPSDSFKSILLDNGTFTHIDALADSPLDIARIAEAVTSSEDVDADVPKFSAADLDGDGENEMILWIRFGGLSDVGYEILRYEEGTVYGYMIVYRAFLCPKADGTFEGSGGAADHAIQKMRFSEDGYIVDKLYERRSDRGPSPDAVIQYFAGGEPCSEEEYNDAVNRQDEKPDLEWYELTPENVNFVLENYF